MILQDFSIAQGWVQMKWSSIFKIGWSNAIYALNNMEKLFEKMTVLAGNYGESPTEIDIHNGIPQEKGILLAKGVCKWYNTPIQIIIRPGSEIIEIMAISIFPADYKSLATSYGQLADSMELHIYAANR